METKRCKECNVEKNISEFQVGRAKCKECVHLRQKEWYKKNKNKILINRKEYRQNNKEKIIELKIKSKEKNNITRNKYLKERFAKDYIFKLKHQTRKMILRSFNRKNEIKTQKSEKILGCSIDFFIKYLLKTYKNNYGIEWDGNEKVHIDHIIPLANANTEEEVMQLCRYSNLQLLKAKDNLQKGSKLDFKLKGE